MVFALLFVPGIGWQYRRSGRVSLARLIGWAAVCVYFTGLFVYTMLPLPEDAAAFCAAHTVGANTRPFQFVADIREHTAGYSAARVLRSTVFLQAAFNVILFIPFGVILRRYVGLGIAVTTLAGAAVSGFIEATQFTGMFGLLPCAYRTGDIDDLILNTVGALLGAAIAPLVLWWMPSAKSLAVGRMEPRPVTAWRRWAGMVVDVFLFFFVETSLGIAFGVAHLMIEGQVPTETPTVESAIPTLVALLLVFIVPSARGRGATAGQTIVWLTPKWVGYGGRLTDATVWRRLARSLVIVGPWVVGTFVPLVGFVAAILVLAEIVMVPMTRTSRSLSGIVTGARFVDSREAPAGVVIESTALYDDER